VDKSILYVDDEPALCRAFERALRAPGMRIVTTTSGPEAVALLASQDFDVVATDYRMPEIDGLTLLRQARDRVPNARRLLVSGRIDGDVTPESIDAVGIDGIVTKPWSLDDLRRVVRHAAEFATIEKERRVLLARTETLVAQSSARDLVLLLAALELRDADTCRHAERVARLARATGQAMGLDEEDLIVVEKGALLHDVGKIGVPDRLLRKPEKLDEEEWKILSRHPAHGAELLERIEVPAATCRIVRQHHERMDGRGYPAGLAGEDICQGARIVSVADAYDAIRMDRPYRKGRSHEVAVAEIAAHAGTQFDPRVVEVFLTLPENDARY
jgi:putative nucleotidyltransferase with HDIG domain